ncbi:MAG: hypothetical protein V2B17_06320 [Chloroflexota bacterium]
MNQHARNPPPRSATPPEVSMSLRSASRRHSVLVAMLATVALIAAACGPSAPTLTDPVQILQKGAASLGEMKTFHLRGTIDGEVPLDLGGIGSGGGGAPLPLDGTTIDGDVDVAAGELAVELLAPALLNLRVNIVVANGSAYLKSPLITGRRWVRQPAEGGIGGDPGAALAGLAAFLARPEPRPEKLPDTRCSGTDCYGVRLIVPAEEVRAALGWLGSVIPGLSGDGAGGVAVTAGVRKDDLRLATLGLQIQAGGTTPLTIVLELDKVNEPVTIDPPPADQVDAAPGG